MKLRPALLSLLALSAALSVQAADAKTIWQEQCSKCHGLDGSGQTKMGKKLKIPDLTTKYVQSLITDAQAFKIIKEGVKDDNEKVAMKAAEGVNDEEIKALVQLVRSFRKQ
jgi:cytochrome c551/c552